MFVSVKRHLLLRPYYFALLIVALLFFWMLSKPAQSEMSTEKKSLETIVLPKVKTTHFIPEKIIKELSLYGKSEANSRAIVRAEVAGKIVKVSVKKGQYANTGSRLVNIEKSELPERLAEAEAQLAEQELNFKAVKSLNEKGLQGLARLAETKSLY